MGYYEYSHAEKLITAISTIALVQAILIALRVNGNYDSHWSIVFIPTYFMFFVWGLLNVHWFRNYQRNVGWVITEIQLFLSVLDWLGLLAFFIVLSFELTTPGSIGVVSTFWSLLITLAANIVVFVIWPHVVRRLYDQTENMLPSMGAFNLNYSRNNPTKMSTAFSEVQIQPPMYETLEQLE